MNPYSLIINASPKKLFPLILVVGLLFGLAGPAGADTGVLVTGAPDYTSGATVLIDVDPPAGPRAAQLDILPTAISDLIVRSYGEYFYRIERYKSDSVAKFHISAPATPIWQYSTLNSPDQVSNNPHDMIFLSQSKAYMPMYGTNGVWIVNPGATTEAEFRTGTVDLTVYADSDGIAEIHEGVIIGGKMFLVIQRLDRNSSWWPVNTSYVAVIDTATDTEIDTGMGTNEGLLGIPLPVKSPNVITYQPELNKLFISCAGRYPSGDPTGYEYTGGVVVLDPETYETTVLIEDGDADNHPYGAIGSVEIVSPTKGYFVGYAGYNDTSVFPFNPTTGEVADSIPSLNNKSVTVTTSGGIKVDKNGLAWVTNRTDFQMYIISTSDESTNEIIDTNLTPLSTTFCAAPGDLDAWIGVWYTQVLNREATADDITQMKGALQANRLTANSMAAMLLHGASFTERNVTDEQYVNIIFQIFQGRDASDGEMSGYLAMLAQQGGRDIMLASFIKSGPFWRQCRTLGIQAF